MLEQTFIHIPGVGRLTERGLWASGIHSWDDADRFEKRFGHVSTRLQRKLDDYIPRSREAVKQMDARFFERLCVLGEAQKDACFFERLSVLREAWRLFPHFPQDCGCLEIETT